MRICLIGDFSESSGVSSAAVSIRQLLFELDYELTTFNFSLADLRSFTKQIRKIPAEQNFDCMIFALNPDLMVLAHHLTPRKRFQNVPKLGFWSWEFPNVPRTWKLATLLLDGIASNSMFTLDAYANNLGFTRRILFPMAPMLLSSCNEVDKSRTSSNASTSFFSTLDADSFPPRKNIFGALEAFKRAFPVGDEKVELVVRVNNLNKKRRLRRALLREVKKDSRITVFRGPLTKGEYLNLLSNCDALVSLHRCEGFGFNIYEALQMNKLVIATSYSGSLEFCNDSNSFLVPFTVKSFSGFYSIYAIKSKWADPDLNVAAHYMKTVHSSKPVNSSAASILARYKTQSAAFDLELNRFVDESKASANTLSNRLKWLIEVSFLTIVFVTNPLVKLNRQTS